MPKPRRQSQSAYHNAKQRPRRQSNWKTGTPAWGEEARARCTSESSPLARTVPASRGNPWLPHPRSPAR
eukprot:11223843-Lingulodinium_polyedra.AAC.1